VNNVLRKVSIIAALISTSFTIVNIEASLYPSPLRQGDPGSWVIDDASGNVVGHVIAYDDSTAFLIPLIHALEAISEQAKFGYF
jgi:hypothetical protein